LVCTYLNKRSLHSTIRRARSETPVKSSRPDNSARPDKPDKSRLDIPVHPVNPNKSRYKSLRSPHRFTLTTFTRPWHWFLASRLSRSLHQPLLTIFTHSWHWFLTLAPGNTGEVSSWRSRPDKRFLHLRGSDIYAETKV
jgi:hypothetical protein